ncbi:urea amidolyase family protein [Acinetobacter ihumii]|uniref:5-oxoprolinase subunit B/C family protein n=1 Tax=Acinetobacter ihumii TaxID=2483802 RepID=UPI001BC86DDC|nr:urea amidolyase family protein [Acinetobacter ihumii]
MRFLSVNQDRLLIELSDLQETMKLYQHLLKVQHPYIVEMIPAASTILMGFNHFYIDVPDLITWIKNQKIHGSQQSKQNQVIIDVNYTGADLHALSDHLGIDCKELIRRHTQSMWQVAFIGFAPGFAYLISPDQPFGSIPRLSSPRKKIPSGSVALAGEYSGIYPKDSPGGWQLIGHTSSKMWDLQREPAALLLPGTQVQFRDATAQPTSIVVPEQLPPAVAIQTQSVAASLEILKTGLQTLIQDQGRPDMTALGVGHAGAMDQTAFQTANRIVGNPSHAAVLEILNGGLKLKALQAAVIAITGADSEIWLEDASGQQVRMPMYQPIALDAGDQLNISMPTKGLRNYLALRGGIAAEQVLGSSSYDTLAELGAAPLQPNDLIYAADLTVSSVILDEAAPQNLPKTGQVTEVDLILGPRTDWFKADSVQQFFQQSWRVTQESNRIGLRLQGEYPLQRQIQQELPSEGTCTGALQIPPNGQPVLFMNDHPLTGGYPVIAAVAKHHLDVVAQMPAGTLIKFRQISEFLEMK